MIAIVDYGMGNLRSVQKGLEKVGAAAEIIRTPAAVARADKLILPGVGAFGDAMHHLHERDLVHALRDFAATGKPFIGICLGLQLLFDVSYEEGEHQGLGLVPGKVVRFDFADINQDSADIHQSSVVINQGGGKLKVPHMGWNQVHWTHRSPLLAGLETGQYFYFVHSYHAVPADDAVTLGRCDYGYPFTAMIERDNIFAAQFHPEKSQQAGLQILKNFAELSC